jgi:hypothetical protein
MVILGSVLRFIFIANVFPSSLILVTLMMETLRSSEPSVLTRATRHTIYNRSILVYSICVIWWLISIEML